MSCSFSSRAISLDDFDRICRTCLGEEKVTPIFETVFGEVKASELLEYSVMIEVDNDKLLPQNICENCLSELYKMYEFKKQCHDNEAVLKLLLENPPAENEDKYDKEEEYPCNITLIEEDAEYRCDDSSDSDKREQIENYISDNLSSNKCKSEEKQKKFKRRNHKCHICYKTFSSNIFRAHMRTHTKEKPYQCDICSQSFTTGGNLRRHKMLHTGERPHVCSICGKGFIQAKSLNAHEKVHKASDKLLTNSDGSLKFTCDFCGRGFKRLHPYNLHLEKHSSDKSIIKKTEKVDSQESCEHICDICTKGFKSKYKLKAHRLRHGEKTYLCSDCGKSFATNGGLQSHSKMHTGEKPHTCLICKKSFAHVGTFDAHMLIHSGIKPYNCSYCSKSFTQLTHLNYHLRTHSGERPYSCSYCGKTFALKGNLTVHVRTHTGETPYLCSICGKGFYDSSSLKKHRRNHREAWSSDGVGRVKPERAERVQIPVISGAVSLSCG